MKMLLKVISLLLLGTIVGLLLKHYPGYLLISLPSETISMKLWLACIAILSAFVVVNVLWKLLQWILSVPLRLRQFRKHQQQKRNIRVVQQAAIALAEGKYKKVLQLLDCQQHKTKQPFIHYWLAAIAQYEINPEVTHRDILANAEHFYPRAAFAINLNRAELQRSSGQYQQALATYQQIESRHPHHPMLLAGKVRSFAALQLWQQVIDLVPIAMDFKAIAKQEAFTLASKAYSAKFLQLKQNEALIKLWAEMPTLYKTAELTLAYAQALNRLGAQSELEQFIRRTTNKYWYPELICLYGNLTNDKPKKRLELAQQWLKKHPNDVDCLFTCAKLAAQAGLHDRAKDDFIRCLEQRPTPEVYSHYAHMLDKLGDKEASNRANRAAMMLLVGKKS